MEIKIGKGLSNISFGMSEKELKNICGVPDKEYVDEFGDKYVMYYDSQVVYKFECENDNILGWIEVHHSKSTLFGQNLFEKPQEEVITFLTKTLGEAPEIEDYHSVEYVTYQDHWLELQFALGKLRNINFGLLYDADDRPIINF